MRMREIKAIRCINTSSTSTILDCCAMDSRYLLVLCLLCGLETDCQTFLRLSFGDNIAIPNHGYVDLGMVETSYTNSVQCPTDLSTCCRSDGGIHRGQWYFPDSDPLQNKSGDGNVYEFGGKYEA